MHQHPHGLSLSYLYSSSPSPFSPLQLSPVSRSKSKNKISQPSRPEPPTLSWQTPHEIINNPSSSNNTNTTQILVGQDAKDQLTTHPQNTTFNWQRLIRLPYGDPIVQTEVKHAHIHYNIVSSVPTPLSPANSWSNLHHSPAPRRAPGAQEKEDSKHFPGLAMIQIPAHIPALRRLYMPEELTTLLDSHIKHLTETQAGIKFMQAFVIIPNDYTQGQMDALDQAIEAAGLSRARLDRRHIAPALVYRLNSHQPGGDNVVIVKLDPEYLDVVVAYMYDGEYEVMGPPERTEVRYDDEAANRPVLEYLVDKNLSWARGVNATGLLDKTRQQHTFE